MTYNFKTSKTLILSLVFWGLLSSCKKSLEVDPPTNEVGSDAIFINDATATGAISGIYSEMMNSSNQFTNNGLTLYTGMTSDELNFYTSGTRDEFETNQISVNNHSLISSQFWATAYKYIYIANLSLEKLATSTLLSSSVRETLTGECKFIRAFCYFHLVNLFGDVPLLISSGYRENSIASRTSVVQVYSQIETDLKDAQTLLNTSYPTSDRARPNKWAATALLARIYLYTGQWVKAEEQATAVINSGSYTILNDLNQVFLRASNESIWQLQPVNTTRNTWEGNIILPATNSSIPTYLLTNSLLSAFETGDLRRSSWVKSRVYALQTLYYPYKYKVQSGSTMTEHYVVLRLAEQFLIRAEGRAQQNNIAGAISDLNIIRQRAGLLPLLNTIDQAACLLAVEQERRIELFSEWGHRWHDLIRTTRADVVLGTLKPTTWQSTDKLWPIPINQINLNSALQQNPGY